MDINELKNRLDKFFKVQIKSNFKKITEKDYYFSIGSLSSFLYDMNPDKEFIDGRITINSNNEPILNVKFNYFKVIIISLVFAVLFGILMLFVFLVFRRSSQLDLNLIIIFCFLVAIIVIGQMVVTTYRTKLIIRSLSVLEKEIQKVKFPNIARNLYYISSFLVLAICGLYGFILGYTS